MNMLAALFAGAALLAGAVLAGYRMRTRGPAAAGKSVFLAGFAGVLLVSSLGVYATLGRWSDWDKAEVDHDVDYLLAAKLTDARRLVQMTPDSAYAQQQLALVSLEVGRYEDAVSAIDRGRNSRAAGHQGLRPVLSRRQAVRPRDAGRRRAGVRHEPP